MTPFDGIYHVFTMNGVQFLWNGLVQENMVESGRNYNGNVYQFGQSNMSKFQRNMHLIIFKPIILQADSFSDSKSKPVGLPTTLFKRLLLVNLQMAIRTC